MDVKDPFFPSSEVHLGVIVVVLRAYKAHSHESRFLGNVGN